MSTIKSRLLNGGSTELEKTVDRIWALTVIMDQPGTALRFLFSDSDRAKEQYSQLTVPKLLNQEARIMPDPCEIEDDYGTRAWLERGHIVALNLADVNAEQEGQNEYNLICAVKQAELQRRAASDPRLQAGSGLVKPQMILPTRQ